MMDCLHIPELRYGDFSQRLHNRLVGQRYPVSGSVELTFRCNLRCVHCYVADGAQGRPDRDELTAAEMDGIFAQLADAGCLWLLLTGGEPLLRRDFTDIYLSAKRKGMLIYLYTNGTLITPRLADFLAEWQPFAVDITLYGRTQATYERITGVPGSHARCMQAIDLLLERKVPLRLKTMLMTLNQHELWDMQSYAESLGVAFRFDPLINNTLGGAHSPQTYRLPPQEVVQFDRADRRRWDDLRVFYERMPEMRIDDTYLYACGAGINSFHIDPYGKLYLCMMSRTQGYDLREGSFQEGWANYLPQVRLQPHGESYECNRCKLLPLCGQCPSWGTLENGDPEYKVEYLCQIAHQRAAAFESTSR